MAEKFHLHVFKPSKGNRFACDECPYLANNPIHMKSVKDGTVMVRGTATPTKLG